MDVKKSKRHTLNNLASDWRETIFDRIQSEKLKLAVAVLSAAGCRPSELETGVLVDFRDDQLRIVIKGSKVDERSGRGQPVRLLTIDCKTPWAKYLVQKIAQSSEHTILVRYDAGGISQRLREKSREIWPRRKTLVSAYSYRHFLAKSMKESGCSAEQIAMTLGHASDRSQAAYGRAGGGRKTAGQHGIKDARATNPVRHSSRADRLKNISQQCTVELRQKTAA